MNKYSKLLCSLLLSAAGTPLLWAQNSVQKVEQVSDGVVLEQAVDFTITGTTPFATAGSVNLINPDAVVIFEAVRPANVKKSAVLSHITINGEAAKHGTNCWIEIHKNGTIVYPHTELTFQPLTAYSEGGFAGTEWNDFIPYTKYTSGDWVNNIRSFRLKRGYMATLACNSNGSGWSKVFIAQDSDLEIDLTKVTYGKYIAGKEGFIRVFPWRNVTKKGTAGSPGNRHRELNTTWMYGWNGDGWHDDYVEHIPQHHHEGWPSWDGINGLNTCNTVLGNNEPDNQGDDREQYIPVADIESRLFGASGTWQNQAYTGGLRVGSPAMSGDARGSWLSTFMNLAEQYNCRIDFIADHCYWHDPASSYTWQMNETYNKYHRPIWITEFNYGANWTAWESSDHSGSDANQTIELNNIRSIVTALENNTHVERYAFYNWVEDCRALVFDKVTRDSQGNVISTETILTKTFYWYRDLMSNSAYDPINEYTMGWTYCAPTDLKVNYYQSSNTATLIWTHRNGKQTDVAYVERRAEGESTWTVIKEIPMPGSITMSCQDDLGDLSGLITYRVRNVDSDGTERRTGEATINIGGSTMGCPTLQYTTLNVANLDEAVSVTFKEPFEAKPAVFVGLQTFNNSSITIDGVSCSTVTTPYFKTTSIKRDQFSYIGLPWALQTNNKGESTSAAVYKSKEKIPFMVIPFGNYTFGNMKVEVGSAKIKDETVEVVFNEPFPEGVTPIVVATINAATSNSRAIMHKVWNITNTGFSAAVMYEDALVNSSGSHIVPNVNQTLAYIAATPGDACVDEENQVYLAAGMGQNTVVGTSASEQQFQATLTDEAGEPYTEVLRLIDPVVFCDNQTNNLPTPVVLRTRGLITETGVDEDEVPVTYATGFKVRRVVDESVTKGINKVSSGTADEVGWMAIHSNPTPASAANDDPTPTAIGRVIESTYSGDELDVRVINRIVYVKGHPDFQLFTTGGARAAAGATQAPGVYVVRAGGKTAKIVIR
jgi:hypothetical protein